MLRPPQSAPCAAAPLDTALTLEASLSYTNIKAKGRNHSARIGSNACAHRGLAARTRDQCGMFAGAAAAVPRAERRASQATPPNRAPRRHPSNAAASGRRCRHATTPRAARGSSPRARGPRRRACTRTLPPSSWGRLSPPNTGAIQGKTQVPLPQAAASQLSTIMWLWQSTLNVPGPRHCKGLRQRQQQAHTYQAAERRARAAHRKRYRLK